MTKKNTKKQNIAVQFKELEAIAKKLEEEEIDLEEGISDLERGLELAKELKKKLTQIENRVVKIKKDYQEIDD